MSKIQQYYDETAEYYQKLGLNDRNYKIHELLFRFGLKKSHFVLEIGCGVGVQTQLLAKACRKVTAIDISTKSIEIAKQQYSKLQNIEWIAADIFDLDFKTLFDIIVLPDVLHYIPEMKYGFLFEKMKQWLAPNGFILIHSPSAAFVEWSKKNDVTKLNIDDIAIDNQQIMKHCNENLLNIQALEQYALWHRGGDFQYIIIRHNNNDNFDIRDLSFFAKTKKHLNKLILRIFR